jgi:4'-phosphopantetheinyl transferase
MNIYWFEQTEAHVPLDNDWLRADEILRLRDLRFAKRRSDWRLGRWTAKSAVASYLRLSDEILPLAEIEIRPAPSGAPEVFFGNDPAGITISLTHRDGIAACAVTGRKVLLGFDLEIVEPHSDAFITDYFTAEEQALLAHSDDKNLLSALLWSAKESALKALHAGLRLDTRCLVVRPSDCSAPVPPATRWNTLRVRYKSARVFNGWWQQAGKLVRTVVSDPAAPPPTFLSDHRCSGAALEETTEPLHPKSAAVSPA